MRKQPYKPKYPIIKKIFPIFRWIQCDYCGCKFKKEYGWEIWVRSVFANIEAERRYSCMTCNPDEETVKKRLVPDPFRNYSIGTGRANIDAAALPDKE
ncbi:hypothetical protein Ami103574_04365 [Aminipila butyrica]|uniref:Uncharacterized protein n=1 Tax=Aminipila butyrica TaxID=433296 RepID=A0A858BRN6_9FIRM|nr:hypothetical protein [Aminipila butyrica]QIB68601.1 hypothetical protein Ami103574_04365 [Aminipila butyrica]